MLAKGGLPRVLALTRALIHRRSLHQSATLLKPPAFDSLPRSNDAALAPPPPPHGPSDVKQAVKRAAKESGNISSVFATLSGGSLSTSLPSRFLDVKRNIVKSPAHAEAIKRAWTEVLACLVRETEDIVSKGSDLIPQVDYPGDDVAERHPTVHEWVQKSTLNSLKKRGAVIVKGVVEKEVALGWKQAIRDYVKLNPQTKGKVINKLPNRAVSVLEGCCSDFFSLNLGFPEENPQVYELYWSKAQLAARGEFSIISF